MSENFYERVNRVLSWKRVLTFNVGLFIILIIPLSVNLAQTSTENRSGAAAEIAAPSVTPPPNYPAEPPKLERVTMFFGKPGDTVVLLGNNFGDYQWGSSVYVGNAVAGTDNIVRWSNSVIEVKIPDSARSGKVWITVNGVQSAWNGTLLIYDGSASSPKVALERLSANEASFHVSQGSRVAAGMVELGYVSEPLEIVPAPGVRVTSQTQSADALGKKMQINFELDGQSPLDLPVFSIKHPGIGVIELVRVELYDADRSLLPIYADPLSMKVLP